MFEVSEAPRLKRGLARLVLAPPPEVWGGFVTVRIANLRLPADSTTTRSDLELPAGACPLVEPAVAGSHRVLRGSEIVRQAAAAGQEEIEVHVLSGGERAAANLTALGVPMEFAVAVAAVEKQMISAPQPRAAE